jgi:hypothetical protein
MRADRIGALEENDRTSIMIVDGKRLVRYFDGTEKLMMNVMLQGQDTDQKALMSDMWDMLHALRSSARSIRSAEDSTVTYNVQSVRPLTAPAPVGKSPLMWFYKANIEIIYIKKE